jgi:hypothetical protein
MRLRDFVFPTTNVGNGGFGDDVQLSTGTESVGATIVREIVASSGRKML